MTTKYELHVIDAKWSSPKPATNPPRPTRHEVNGTHGLGNICIGLGFRVGALCRLNISTCGGELVRKHHDVPEFISFVYDTMSRAPRAGESQS